MCLPIDPVFEFSEIGHHGIEPWSFSKEHLPHVPGSRSDSAQRGTSGGPNPKASVLAKSYRFVASRKKIFPCSHNACHQAEFFHRKLAVIVPTQTGQVVDSAARAGAASCPNGRPHAGRRTWNSAVGFTQ